jgi:hypothetical protein
MITYKLFKIRKDGSIGSLFMNPARKLPINEWLKAEGFHKKGFKYRPYWHTMPTPHAPHLSGKNRGWYKVEIKNYTKMERPSNLGKYWYLAKQIRILSSV